MNFRTNQILVALLAFVFCQNTVIIPSAKAQGEAGNRVKKTAIFTYNRAGDAWNGHMRAFEDLVSAQVVELGFDVISREMAIQALNEFPTQPIAEAREHLPGVQLDRIFSNNTSALRLAKNLGADYLISASLTTYGETTKATKAYGNTITKKIGTLRMSYRVAEGVYGGAVISDSVEVKNEVRQTEFESVADGDLYNRLISDGARLIGASLKAKLKTQSGRLDLAASTDLAEFRVTAVLSGISLPDVVVDENGNASVGQKTFPVEAVGVTVELDGAVVGTTPGAFQATPGIHKMRVFREGFKDWERTVNIFNNQKLSVALELSEAGLKRWKDKAEFIANLKRETTLTKGEYEVLIGVSQFLKQSGYRVDTKDVPVTNNNSYQSLFSHDVGSPIIP